MADGKATGTRTKHLDMGLIDFREAARSAAGSSNVLILIGGNKLCSLCAFVLDMSVR